MAPRILLSSPVPVVLLPHDAPRILSRTTGPSTNLTALLTHSPAQDTVTLTLSDLSTRLLLLRYELTAAQYAPLRESQSLLIDFAAFPTHMCDLLQRVSNVEDFIATLRLPQFAFDDYATQANQVANNQNHVAVLSIIQTSAVKSITHIELPLRRATHEQLVAAVAARAREAELADARARQLQRELDDERARARDEAARAARQLEELQQTSDRLRRQLTEGTAAIERATRLDEEITRLEGLVRDRDVRVNEAREQMATNANVREECDRLRQSLQEAEHEAEQSEEGRRRAIVERDEARREVARVTAERDESVREITRGNDILQRLQTELRTQRAKTKVKSNVIAKQEDNVRKLEGRVAELERELRRMRDRAALLEVEKDGINERLKAASRKLEENAAVLASDQQVIAYLNRELNERAIGDVGGATTGGATAGGATTGRTQRGGRGLTSGA